MSTTANDFSAPVYVNDTPANTAAPATTGNNGIVASNGHDATSFLGSQDAELEAMGDASGIDLNDPNLLSAELDTNADVDAYAAPPPIPDARYRAKLKQIDVKGPDGQPARYSVKVDKNGKPYAYIAIQGNVQDPGGKFDNIPVWDRFVSTMQQRNGGIPIVALLKAMGQQIPAKSNAKTLVEMTLKALAAEPEVEIETHWEGGLDEADRQRFQDSGTKQPRVLGMHRFPQNAKGEHVPDLTVDTALGKVNLHAQVRIRGYYPVGSGKLAAAAAAGR